MAIVDKDTKLESGVHSGICNYMIVGESSKPDKTVVQFIEFGKMTGDHVDTAKIVGDVELFNNDLKSLIKMLNDRAKELDS